MSEFGATLKQAREDRGITLREIAAATKISVAALEALERDDFSRLPGGIFSRAFVRSYALEVGLDPDQTVATFIEEYDRAASLRAERVPRPEVTADDREFLERQRRAATILRVVLIVLVLAIAGGVIWWQAKSSWGRAKVEDTASNTVELPPSPPPQSNSQPPAAPSTPEAAAPASLPAAPPAGAGAVAIHLEVTEECWIRAIVDGTVTVSEVLRAGDKRDIPAGREVSLDVGNSAALKWTINGKPGILLGKPGQTASVRISQATLARYLQ